MRRWTLLLGLLVAVAATPAWAADLDPPVWHVNVAPYVWAAGTYGNVTVKGVTVPVSSSFLDVLEATDSIIGLQGHLEITRGRWGGFFDGTYMKMKVDDAGPTRIDVTNRMALLEFGLSYRVLGAPGGDEPGAAIDVYGGGRYTFLEVDLDSAGAPSLNRSQEWVDPIVGARLIANLTERVVLIVGGDIGGFGVSSDFAWSAMGLVGYRFQMFGMDAAVVAGYRALDQDFSTGRGLQRFRYDVIMHGPILGLNVRF